MGLREDIPTLLGKWKEHGALLKHNQQLFEIFEGDLLSHVLADLERQLSPQSYKDAVSRVTPVNVLRRLVDKLSKIYDKAPLRTVTGGTESDEALLTDYVEAMDLNTSMGSTDGANGLFNLFKNVWVEPFKDGDGFPRIRVLTANGFFVYSNDPANPTKPTHLVKIMGEFKDKAGNVRTLFYAYTADEFLAFDSEMDVRDEKMAALGNDGRNPFGCLPGVYINRSKHLLVPKADSDTLAMTKLIPVQLSDLSYAMMYQCFSVLYTIDVDQSGLKLGPNALWDLKSDAKSDKEPKVGTIKPEVDSDKALSLIKAIFSLWMETRNIKAGTMGQLSANDAASGVAKIIDEMDTSGDRKAQVPYFKAAEEQLFKLLKDHYHPVWAADRDFRFKGQAFSVGAEIKVTFPEQRPAIDSTKAIEDQTKKLKAGLQTIKGALKELYPDATEKEIEEKLKELADEAAENQAKAQAIADAGALNADDSGDTGADDEDGSGEPKPFVLGKGGPKKPKPGANA